MHKLQCKAVLSCNLPSESFNLLINNLFSYVLCTKYAMNRRVNLMLDSMTVFQKYVVVSSTREVVNRQSVHIYTSLVDEG